MNSNILNLENVVKIEHSSICYLIIHQNHQNHQIPSFLNRKDITVIQNKSKGLAKSRNIGLENCKTKYVLLADDDIEYIEEGIFNILNVLNEDNVDFATFKIKTSDNESEFRTYFSKKTLFNNTKIQVASIEIVLNVDSLRKYKIKFDERFGLGTILRQGEEEILINDLLRKKYIGYFYPTYIVKHPFESTSTKNINELKKYFIKGAYYKRIEEDFIFPVFKSLIRKYKNLFFYHLGRFYIIITNYFYGK